MNRPSRDNVQCIRVKTSAAVVSMPARPSYAQRSEAGVLQMSDRFHRFEHKAPVVLPMPSQSNGAREHSSAVVEMPARSDSPDQREGKPGGIDFSATLRMTLVALFALLGWPKPTHGSDPGAAAARPWKLELLNAISKVRIPAPDLPGRLAAQRPVLEFPRPVSVDSPRAGFARAA